MALSNIFREPRREITESVVGLVAVALPVYGDFLFAKWFQEATTPSNGPGCPWPIGMALGILIVIGTALFVTAAVYLTHAIGDSICNVLQRRGLHLRPRQRY